MAKSIEMSVQAYAKTVGLTRGSIYRHIYDREAGRPSKLPKSVKIKKVVDHYVLMVPVKA